MKLTATSAQQATHQRQLQQETKVSWKTMTTLNQQGQVTSAKARNNKQRKVLRQSPLLLTLIKSVAANISLTQPCSPAAKLQSWLTCTCCSQPTAFSLPITPWMAPFSSHSRQKNKMHLIRNLDCVFL